jgi:Glycosyl hydrolases family 39
VKSYGRTRRGARQALRVFVCGAICTLHVLVGAAQVQAQRLVPAQVPIPSTYFGMHIHLVLTHTGLDPQTPWPRAPVPAWRLWDVHVTWSDLEPAKGQYKFAALDKLLELAHENNTEVQLTFGFTPRWTSTRPTEPSFHEPGNAAEPQSIEDWKEFVLAVATHCRGQVHIYEIWNEPNLRKYWSGSVEQLVELAHQAHDAIKAVDPSATIVSPSPTGQSGLVWLSSFLGAGGGRYIDVIGFHFYVDPAPPETMVPLIQSVEAIMRGHQVGEKPLWDTEAGWAQPHPFPSDELAAAYVARAFLLNWASGVKRFY